MQAVEILECVMLVCFGLSWPISVYKSAKSKSTAGKSPIFMTAILTGYTAGIVAKVLGGNITYVLALYVLNFSVVTVDFVLYFINRRRERASAMQKAAA